MHLSRNRPTDKPLTIINLQNCVRTNAMTFIDSMKKQKPSVWLDAPVNEKRGINSAKSDRSLLHEGAGSKP